MASSEIKRLQKELKFEERKKIAIQQTAQAARAAAAQSQRDYEKQLKLLEQIGAGLDDNAKKTNQNYLAQKKITEDQRNAATEAEKNAKKEEAVLANKEKKIKDINTQIEKGLSYLREEIEDYDELESSVESVGSALNKNNKYYQQSLAQLEKQKAVTISVASIVEREFKLGKITDKDVEGIYKKVEAQKQFQISIADANALYGRGEISEEDRVKQITQAKQKYEESTGSIKLSVAAEEAVGDILRENVKTMDSFANSAKNASVNMQTMDNVFSTFSGIPVMTELNALLKTNIRDTLAWKAAVFALGAALGKAAYDYFGAPIKAAMQADKERAQNEIDTAKNVAKLKKDGEFIPAQIAQERREQEIENANNVARTIHEAAYAGARAAHEFQVSMKQGAAQFERAAKTALFGNKLGSVGYGAAQLQLAGIGADKIASAMTAAADATGKMPTAKIGADMAIMSERTGASTEDIAQISSMFQRLDGMSAEMALNMQEGMRAMANKAGISLSKLMKEVAESSKDALGYQIKSGPVLAKQVAYAQSLGLNFGDIAKAGKSMVLNYKDSIKSEMRLSALLGKQVDLSEVRAKFAEGDQKGAIEALKAQGLDPSQMGMFEQEELTKATGMDLDSLQKIFSGEVKEPGDLKAGDAKAAGKDFLKRTEQAEASLNAQQAQISAQSAIFDAKLSAKIADAYLASPEYQKYKAAQNAAAQEAEQLSGKMNDAWLATDEYKKSLSDSMKLDFVTGIKENLMSGLSVIGGGLATTLIDRLIPKKNADKANKGFFSRFGGLFGGKKTPPTPGPTATGGAPAPAAMPSSAPAKTPAAAPILTLLPATTQFNNGVQQMTTNLNNMSGPIQNASRLLPASVSNVANQLNSLPATIKNTNSQMNLLPASLSKVTDGFSSAKSKMNDFIEDAEFEIMETSPAKSMAVGDAMPLPLPVTIVGGMESISSGIGGSGDGDDKSKKGNKKGAFSKIGDWFKKKWEGITGGFKRIGDGIGNAWKSVTGFFSNIADKIGNVWNSVTDWFKGIFQGISDGIGNAWQKVTGFFSGIATGISNAWTGVTGFFSEKFTQIGDKISNAWKTVTGFFSSVGDKIKEKWEKVTGFFSGVGDMIKEKWGKVTGFFSGIGTKIQEKWAQVTGFFNNVFLRISEKFTSLIENVKKMFSVKGLKSIFKRGGKSAAAGGGEEGGGEEGTEEAGGGIGTGMASVSSGMKGIGPAVKHMGPAAKGLGKLGTGFADMLKALGKGAGGLIEGLLRGIANGIGAFANPTFVIGAGALALGITLIGGGIAAASWLLGKALPTLAEGFKSFEQLDGDRLISAGAGMAAIAGGMAAFGVGSVVGGVGTLIGGIFGKLGELMGAKGPFEQFKEFAELPINPEGIKEKAEAFAAFGAGMAAAGGGQAVGGLGMIAEGIGSFFKAKPPLQQFKEFTELPINTAGVKEKAEAFKDFGAALANAGKGMSVSGFGMIAQGLGAFFKVKPPLEQFKDFAETPINMSGVKEKAESFKLFAEAIGSFSGGSGSVGGILADSLASFFKLDPPLDQFKKFAEADLGKDKEKVKANAEVFGIFAEAISKFKGSGGTLGGVLAEGLRGFFKLDPPYVEFQKFAAQDFAKDKEKVKGNAEAFGYFAEAMSKFEGTKEGVGGAVVAGLKSFFDATPPYVEFQNFANLPLFDKEKVKSNAEAFIAFGNAMKSYVGTDEGFFSGLGKGLAAFFGAGKTDVISDFERFSKINASGVVGVSEAIGVMSTKITAFNADAMTTVGSSLENFVDYLNDGETEVFQKLGPALQSLGTGLMNISNVQNNPNIAAIGVSLKSLVDSKIFESIGAQSTPIINFSTALTGLNTALSSGLVTGINTLTATGPSIILFQTTLLGFVNSKALETLAGQATYLSGFTTVLNGFSTAMTAVNVAFAGGIITNFSLLSTLSTGIDLTTAAVIRMTDAFKELSGVDLTSIKGIPWDKMTNFGKVPGGSVVLAKNANNNFTIEKNSAKNIELQLKKVEDFTTTTKQLLEVNKNLQALLDAQITGYSESNIKLMIDGKQVSRVIKKRDENDRAQSGITKTGPPY